MTINNNDLNFGMAIVTAKGLLFNNLYYSNQNMIKHKWFETSSLHDNLQIPILFHSNNTQIIALINCNEIEYASVVEPNKAINQEIVKAYYETINNLKLQRSNQAPSTRNK